MSPSNALLDLNMIFKQKNYWVKFPVFFKYTIKFLFLLILLSIAVTVSPFVFLAHYVYFRSDPSWGMEFFRR